MSAQIWAAVVVISDYILCITLYAAMLMIHHRWIKKWEDPLLAYTCCICCTLCCGKKDKSEPKSDAEPQDNVPTDAPPAALERQLSVRDGVGDGEEYRGIEKFLGQKWSKWIDKTKIPNLVFFFILFVVAISLAAAQLEPDEEAFNALWKTQSWLYALEETQSDFGTSEDDGLLGLFITYGIKGVDRLEIKTFEPDDIGDVVWDSDFEMWSTAQQEYLYTTCQELKNSSLVYQPPNSEFVKCPIEEWKDYLETMNMTFPYDASSESAFAEMWNSFLNSDNAENTMAYQLSYVDNDGGDYTVKFYAMYIQLPVTDSAPSTVVKEYRDDFDDYIAENKDDCPGTLCDYMHNSCYRWWLLALEENFVISAFTGIAMALPLAFIVLLISTRNWIISIFAILDIIGVISCELCAFYVFQWKFGVVESVAVIMIIGFSVGMCWCM